MTARWVSIRWPTAALGTVRGARPGREVPPCVPYRLSPSSSRSHSSAGASDRCGPRPPPLLCRSSAPTGAQRGTQVTVTIQGTNIGDATRLIFSEPGLSARITAVEEMPVEKMVVPKGVVRTDAPIDDKARKFALTAVVTIAKEVPHGVHGVPAAHPARRVQSAALRGELAGRNAGTGAQRSRHAAERSRCRRLWSARSARPATSMPIGSPLAPARRWSSRSSPARSARASTASSVFSTRRASSRREQRHRSEPRLGADLALHRCGNLRHCHRGPRARRWRGRVRLPHLRGRAALPHRRVSARRARRRRGRRRRDRREPRCGLASGWRANRRIQAVRTVPVTVGAPRGSALNRKAIALGAYPEALEREPNSDLALAQPLAIPSSVNGRIWTSRGGTPEAQQRAPGDQDLFKFTAVKGQKLVFEVTAQQLGSPLDSIVEVLDAQGRIVPRALVRCLAQTEIALNDPDSTRRSIRLLTWNELAINDYLLDRRRAAAGRVAADASGRRPSVEKLSRRALGAARYVAA